MTITGGPVFWILLALVASSAFVWLERLVDLRRAQINVQDFLKGVINVLDSGNDEEALAICEDEPAPVAAVVATAIRHANGSARLLRDAVDSEGRAAAGRLDRRLAVLAIVAQVAPLLGLFGTVVGFIKVVMRVSGADLASRADLVGGAMEALVSAALGLAVAIAVTVMYGSLRVRLDRIVVELETAASQIVGYLATRREEQRK